MESLISLIVEIIIFAVAVWAIWWICIHFNLPQPVLWLSGTILLLMVLMWVFQVGESNQDSVSKPLEHYLYHWNLWNL